MNSPRSTQRSQRARREDFGLRIADCGLILSLCVLCGCFYRPYTASAAQQDVVPVDGPAFQGELVSIAEGHASFRVSGQQPTAGEFRALALDRLVRWGNPVAPKAQAIVVLTDGGQIVAAT